MTVDKSRCNLPIGSRMGDTTIPAEGLQLSTSHGRRGHALRSVRIEGLPGGKDMDGTRLRSSDSAASLASADCQRYNRSSSCTASESSLSLQDQPSSCSVAAASLPAIPRSFMCPISLQVMMDPVCTVDSMIYDRQSIEAFFRSGRCTSPVTGMQLSSLKLRSNAALKEAIEAYLELHREAECQWKDWEAYMQEQASRCQQKLAKKRMQIRELRAALEASERQVLALELGKGGKSSSKGYAASNVSSAPSSTDDSNPSSQELSPQPRDEAAKWKAGPAPRPDANLLKKPQERSRGLLSFFR